MKNLAAIPLLLFSVGSVSLAQNQVADPKAVLRGGSIQIYSSALDTSKSIQVTLTPDKHAGICPASDSLAPIPTVASTSSTFNFSVPFEASSCVYAIGAVQVPGDSTKPLSLSPSYLRVTDQPPMVTAVSPKVLLADSLHGEDARNCSAAWTFLGPPSLKADADYRVRFAGRAASKCTDAKATSCYTTAGSTDGQIKVCYHGSTFLREFAGKQTVALALNAAESAPHEITFIPASSTTPRYWSLGLTAALVTFVYILIRIGCSGVTKKIFGKEYLLVALFLDEPTQTYSLSKCQFYAWTVASVLGYIYFAISRSIIQNSAAFPEIPGGLPAILLFSAGTAVLTTGIVNAKGNKGAGEVHPSLGDFVTTGGVVAPERLQFVVWTIIGICTFLTIVFKSDPVSIDDLPRIPSGFLQLMGLSSAGYLAGKLARKAGPNIMAVDVIQAAPTLQFVISGSGLSQNASFSINGDPIAPVQILNAEGKPSLPQILQKDETNNEAGVAKIMWLIVADPPERWLGSKNLTVTNPDAQKAVWPYDTTKVKPSAMSS